MLASLKSTSSSRTKYTWATRVRGAHRQSACEPQWGEETLGVLIPQTYQGHQVRCSRIPRIEGADMTEYSRVPTVPASGMSVYSLPFLSPS